MLTSLHRGLALAGLAVAGFGVLAVVLLAILLTYVVGLVPVFPPAIRLLRRLAGLRRRLAREWAGADVPAPYGPPPPPPVPTADGRYGWDNYLYKTPRMPAYLARLDQLRKDRATWRDVRWLLVDPVVGLFLAVGVVVASPFGASARGGALWLHGRWTALLLRPTDRPGVPKLPAQYRTALLRNAALAAYTLGSLPLLALILIGIAPAIGLGMIFLFPPFIEHTRWLANLRRTAARDFCGVPIQTPYRARPAPPAPWPDGRYEHAGQLYRTPAMPTFLRRFDWLFKDPATWRELLWMAVDPVVGGALLLLSLAPVVYGLIGLVIPATWELAGPELSPEAWYTRFADRPLLAIPAGSALVAFGLGIGPTMLRLHGRWSRLLLGPTKKATLALRVAQLTESRADAVDTQAAELRRIERDLHDGAQARLIAVGLSLNTIEVLIDRDPAKAKELVAQARATSAAALADLRDLVRGIHPPVLAERGIADAVRALALDSPVAVTVEGGLPGRPEAAVESAAYFAVAELLANAAKHARARTVRVVLEHDAGTLRITVTDDGRGGADARKGSGLSGLRRRLGTFDGVLAVHSPVGGPTVATLELPCALSSPRTSTS